jgi:hypothetical protein
VLGTVHGAEFCDAEWFLSRAIPRPTRHCDNFPLSWARLRHLVADVRLLY